MCSLLRAAEPECGVWSLLRMPFHKIMGGREEFHIDTRYTELQPLGDGSYGFVVSALDTVTGNKVAIKKMTNW